MREYNLIVQNNSNPSETLSVPVIIYDYDSSKSNYETYIALTTKKYKLRINHSRFNSTVSANISGNVLKESILISDYNPDEWNNGGSSGGTNYGGSGSSSGNGGSSSSSGGGSSSSGGSGGSSSGGGGSSSSGGGTSTNHYIKIVGNAHSYISATTTSVNISVKANVKWKVSDKPDWVNFDKTTGGTANTETTTSVTINFSAYEGSNGRREAYIRFIENNNESGVGVTYNITQYDINEPSENASLSVYSGPDSGSTINNTGAEVIALLNSNTRWVINEFGDAISEPYSGSGNSNLDVVIYQNTLAYSVTSGISVKSLKNNKVFDSLSWTAPKGGELSNYEIQHFSSNFSLSFTGNPGYFSMCLQSHVPWEITSYPDWISLSPLSGSAGEYIIGGYFGGSDTSLSGTIEVSSTDPNYPVTTTKSISTNGQRSDIYIDVKSVYRDDINVSSSLTFNVYSNVNWVVVNYVRSSAGDEYGFFDNGSGRMSGSGNGSVTLNYSGGAGTYYVDLKNEDESVTYYELTVDVYDTVYGSSQYQQISPNSGEGMGPMPNVSRPSLYIKKNGGYYNYATVGIDGGNYDINGKKCEFMIISDSSWYIETPSWISVNKSSGNGDTVVEYTVDENDSGGVRSDVIFVVTSDDYASDTVHVKQTFNSYELVLEIDQDESDHGDTFAKIGEMSKDDLYGGGRIAVTVKLFKNVIQNGSKVSVPSSDWYNSSVPIYVCYWNPTDTGATIKHEKLTLTSQVSEINTMIETDSLWHAHYETSDYGVWAEYGGLESNHDHLYIDEYIFHRFGNIFDMDALVNNSNKPDECDLYINKNYASAGFNGISGVMSHEIYYMIDVSGHSDIMPGGSTDSYMYIDYRGTHSLKIETSSGEDVTNLFSTKTLGWYDNGVQYTNILVSDVSRVWGDLTLTQL